MRTKIQIVIGRNYLCIKKKQQHKLIENFPGLIYLKVPRCDSNWFKQWVENFFFQEPIENDYQISKDKSVIFRRDESFKNVLYPEFFLKSTKSLEELLADFKEYADFFDHNMNQLSLAEIKKQFSLLVDKNT